MDISTFLVIKLKKLIQSFVLIATQGLVIKTNTLAMQANIENS